MKPYKLKEIGMRNQLLGFMLFMSLLGCSTTKPSTQKVYKTDCSELVVDLKKGTLNNLPATESMENIKQKLTCFTGDTEEGEETFNCGGGVFFLNHGFFFYTYKDYIEVRENFKGVVSPQIMGVSILELKKHIGTPAKIISQSGTYFYKMPYGTLRVELDSQEKVREIGLHHSNLEALKLCD
jgi:hypothetical protein